MIKLLLTIITYIAIVMWCVAIIVISILISKNKYEYRKSLKNKK